MAIVKSERPLDGSRILADRENAIRARLNQLLARFLKLLRREERRGWIAATGVVELLAELLKFAQNFPQDLGRGGVVVRIVRRAKEWNLRPQGESDLGDFRVIGRDHDGFEKLACQSCLDRVSDDWLTGEHSDVLAGDPLTSTARGDDTNVPHFSGSLVAVRLYSRVSSLWTDVSEIS